MIRPLLFLSLSGVALMLSSLSAEQIILDDVMTRDEQQRTGVSKMSLKQKIELENWINRTFVLKNPAAEHQTALSMSININNGQKLQLSDESIWEIDPNDVPTAAVWITPFPVDLVPSKDADYPFLIVNKNTGVSVKARKISSGNYYPTPS
jgi:hypothetical protein